MISAFQESAQIGLANMAATAFLYYSHLSVALAVYWDVDASTPGRSLFREEALSVLAIIDGPEHRYTLPSSARRLVAILKLLLERPRVRAAERSVKMEQSGKRLKASFGERESSSVMSKSNSDDQRVHKVREL